MQAEPMVPATMSRGRSIVEESILSAARRLTAIATLQGTIVFGPHSRHQTLRSVPGKEPVARWDCRQRLPPRDVSSSICSLLQFAAVIQKLIERFGIIE